MYKKITLTEIKDLKILIKSHYLPINEKTYVYVWPVNLCIFHNLKVHFIMECFVMKMSYLIQNLSQGHLLQLHFDVAL